MGGVYEDALSVDELPIDAAKQTLAKAAKIIDIIFGL
jgi:hypothetical protein